MAYPHRHSLLVAVLVTLWHIIILLVVVCLIFRVTTVLVNWLGKLWRKAFSLKQITLGLR